MTSTFTRPSVPLLRFLGATGTVTGSRFLIETDKARVLIDCGMFQGLKALRLRNWDPFPVDPATINAVVLTHAHLDHSGYVPALIRNGFNGPVYCTPSTRDLCAVLLPDSGYLLEEEAAYANRRGYSKHSPALPLYTEKDAQHALMHFKPVAFGAEQIVADGVSVVFHPAGHILGSAMAHVRLADGKSRSLLFSGDLGRPNHPILMPPSPPPAADIIITESTYGDREHEDELSLQHFESAIARTAQRGGVIVIPSFAVDRTEIVLYHLRRLIRAGRLPQIPVYVDSPMALSTLGLYRQALASGSPEVKPGLLADGDPFDPGSLVEARRVEDSMAINRRQGPMIIVSASGMATGGRVLHHLLNRLSDERNTVILVGYQADGTRGRQLLSGAASIKMLGHYVGVRAEIVDVPAFSVHADRSEILAWLRTAPQPPQTTFVVHGEEAPAESLRRGIESELKWTAVVPRYLETVRLD